MKLSSAALTKMVLARECPFCEKKKLDGHSFCDTCYMKLPENIRAKIKNGMRQLSEGIKQGVSFLEDQSVSYISRRLK